MSEIELYNVGFSTCSQRVRFVLGEKGVTYVDKRLRLELGEHISPEYLAINPNGLVPSLVHDDAVITDSSVINEYLDEVFPLPRFVPEHPVERAHMRAWVQYLDEVMTPSIRYPSFQNFFGGALRAMSDDQRQQFASRLPLRKYFALEVGAEGFAKQKLDGAMERINQTLNRMEHALARTVWLANDRLTLADIAVMPSIVRLEDLGMSSLWSDLPKVSDWYKRLQATRGFQIAYSAGSRLGEFAN
ncbi:glutathione S-transferase [Pseudomonas sp. GM21]|uniref:glutathione S-transferase family protein n=1 Tax=Pseudomonas sp. GM21 TaxID=1144325 RepID=UPI0002725913|nr:glutathione S-transferase family protein [Pseudomonas sp. GM21]EJM22923.1 glutathione S-transferase [Pseudomonas sp. GM21]